MDRLIVSESKYTYTYEDVGFGDRHLGLACLLGNDAVGSVCLKQCPLGFHLDDGVVYSAPTYFSGTHSLRNGY
jgi:hypothetical protein